MLSFLSGLEKTELSPLFGLFLLPFGNSLAVQRVHPTKQMGFVKMLESVIDQLGSKALPYLSKLMVVLTEILKGSLVPNLEKESVIENAVDNNDGTSVHTITDKLVKSQCLRRCGAIFQKFPDTEFFEPDILKELRRLLVIQVPNLPKSVVGQRSSSAMLELINAFSRSISLELRNAYGRQWW